MTRYIVIYRYKEDNKLHELMVREKLTEPQMLNLLEDIRNVVIGGKYTLNSLTVNIQ